MFEMIVNLHYFLEFQRDFYCYTEFFVIVLQSSMLDANAKYDNNVSSVLNYC